MYIDTGNQEFSRPTLKAQTLDIDGIGAAYREYGSLDAPPMVLLHGLAETSVYFWQPLIAHFAETWHIIAFDLLGHGNSDKPHKGYETAAQARRIAAAMTMLKLAPVVLIGHSLGGVVATRLTLDYPAQIRKLILYDTPLPCGYLATLFRLLRTVSLPVLLPLSPMLLPGAGFIANRLPMRFLLRRVLIQWRIPYDRSQLSDELLDQAVQNTGIALAESIRVTFMRDNVGKNLDKISVPVLMLVGDSDVLVPISEAKRYAAAIKDVRLVIIEHAGHAALLDQPALFCEALASFVDA